MKGGIKVFIINKKLNLFKIISLAVILIMLLSLTSIFFTTTAHARLGNGSGGLDKHDTRSDGSSSHRRSIGSRGKSSGSSRNNNRRAAEQRKKEKKSLISRITNKIKQIGRKVVNTITHPISSAKKAIGDIADGGRRAISSAKNLVSGNGSIEDVLNVGMVGFGGIGGAYLIGDASPGKLALNRNNTNMNINSNLNSKTITQNSINSTNENNRSKRSNGGGRLIAPGNKNNISSLFNPEQVPGYNNTKININKSTVIPGAYIKPKITKVKAKTGLVSSSLNADVLGRNNKVAETNKAMKEFKKEYTAFETNMKKMEREKAETMELVKKLRKYDKKQADEIEKKLNKKQIVEADFNKFAKDKGLITEEKINISYDKKINDPEYDSYKDYLKIVNKIKKENQAKLKEYNEKTKYNKKIVEENILNKKINLQNQKKLDVVLSSQKESIKSIDEEIKKQKSYEKEMDRAIINNSQEQYDSAKEKFEKSKSKVVLLKKIVESKQNEIDKIIKETKNSYL
jgi:protein-tyrosine-phosphatase